MSLLVCIVGSSGLFIVYFLALLGIINIIISYACKWSLQGHFGDNFVFPQSYDAAAKPLKTFLLKFIYFEMATKFFEIFPLLLTVCTVVRGRFRKILRPSQNIWTLKNQIIKIIIFNLTNLLLSLTSLAGL